jgi:hypothetical protein
MNFPDKVTVERVRERYPQGARVELVSMSDPYTTLKSGDKGTVDFVDDTASVFVKWDNGSTLGVVYGEDSIRKVTKAEQIKAEAKKVAATGRTNMFDRNAVFELAVSMDCYALADFIFTHTNDSGAFILSGELPADIEEDLI